MEQVELREKFAELLNRRNRMSRFWDTSKNHPYNRQYLEELISEVKKDPANRKKKNLDVAKCWKILGEAVAKPILDRGKERMDKIIKLYNRKAKALDAELRELAEQIELKTGEREFLFKKVYAGNYSTQGFGASKYARERANLDRDLAEYYGLKVEVRELYYAKSDAWGWRHADYEVVVWLDSELDLEILQKKPGLDPREWIKSCWKRGVNPRVYQPFLPQGLEEKLGLDYFGNDLNK